MIFSGLQGSCSCTNLFSWGLNVQLDSVQCFSGWNFNDGCWCALLGFFTFVLRPKVPYLGTLLEAPRLASQGLSAVLHPLEYSGYWEYCLEPLTWSDPRTTNYVQLTPESLWLRYHTSGFVNRSGIAMNHKLLSWDRFRDDCQVKSMRMIRYGTLAKRSSVQGLLVSSALLLSSCASKRRATSWWAMLFRTCAAKIAWFSVHSLEHDGPFHWKSRPRSPEFITQTHTTCAHIGLSYRLVQHLPVDEFVCKTSDLNIYIHTTLPRRASVCSVPMISVGRSSTPVLELCFPRGYWVPVAIAQPMPHLLLFWVPNGLSGRECLALSVCPALHFHHRPILPAVVLRRENWWPFQEKRFCRNRLLDLLRELSLFHAFHQQRIVQTALFPYCKKYAWALPWCSIVHWFYDRQYINRIGIRLVNRQQNTISELQNCAILRKWMNWNLPDQNIILVKYLSLYVQWIIAWHSIVRSLQSVRQYTVTLINLRWTHWGFGTFRCRSMVVGCTNNLRFLVENSTRFLYNRVVQLRQLTIYHTQVSESTPSGIGDRTY